MGGPEEASEVWGGDGYKGGLLGLSWQGRGQEEEKEGRH